MRFEIKINFKDHNEEVFVNNFSEFEKIFNKLLEKKELYYGFSIKEKRKQLSNWYTYSGRDELIGEWLPTKLYLRNLSRELDLTCEQVKDILLEDSLNNLYIFSTLYENDIIEYLKNKYLEE